MAEMHSGSCLCGRVRFEARGELRGVVYCHCSQCRKQSGHFYAATNVQDDAISISGEENVTWYEASDFARRGFCKSCGSVLFWKHRDLDHISVMAGAFDQPSSLKGECHIFVADKGDYYAIDDELPKYEKSGGSVVVAGNGPPRD
ncbi:MAG: GFA family protein [Phyllobacterium sp.]|uniref:GFA family protein n=1 Tax=Phyllobacterium sp. TaxID=1871046 RepID=UPI0030EFB54A